MSVKPNKKWYHTMPMVVISLILLALAIMALILYSQKAEALSKGKAGETASGFLLPPPPGFHVTKATLRAMPDRYEGPCPAQIKFKVKVTTAGGTGTVVINIVRSDNVPPTVIRLAFDEPGTRDTVLNWNTDISFMGWHQLEISEPNRILSNQAEFSVNCQ